VSMVRQRSSRRWAAEWLPVASAVETRRAWACSAHGSASMARRATLFGPEGVALAEQELAGAGSGGHEAGAVVLAVQLHPVGVGQLGAEVTAVELDRGQVVPERH
jgi:hypothetical protein